MIKSPNVYRIKPKKYKMEQPKPNKKTASKNNLYVKINYFPDRSKYIRILLKVVNIKMTCADVFCFDF